MWQNIIKTTIVRSKIKHLIKLLKRICNIWKVAVFSRLVICIIFAICITRVYVRQYNFNNKYTSAIKYSKYKTYEVTVIEKQGLILDKVTYLVKLNRGE